MKLKRKLKKSMKKIKTRFQKTVLNNKIKRARKGRYVAQFLTTKNKKLETEAEKNLINNFNKVEFKGGKNRKYIVKTRHCPEWDECFEADYKIQATLSGAEGVKGTIGWLGLGFDKEAVVIEVAQTARYGEFKKFINEFRRLGKKPVLNYLMEKLEEEARQKGFKEVKMRVPEKMYFYENPNLQNTNLNAGEIRLHMKNFYKKLADAHGYERQGIFYVKKL